MKKPKLGLPPLPPAAVPLSDAAMRAMINKGGSVLADPAPDQPGPSEDRLKSFTFKIYESELAQIRTLQGALPKRDRISIHDFVLAAVKEKIKKELK